MRLTIVSLLALTPLLAACETSSRISPLGGAFGSSERIAPERRDAPPPRIETAPTARVESSPLAPPPGTAAPGASGEFGTELPPPVDAPQVGGTPSTDPLQTARTETPRPAPEPVRETAPTRTSVTGNWTAKTGGGSCRITLSSAPKLDLYNATTQGCASRDLARVNAWELRGDEVYLYESGGTVTARLKARSSAMDGALAKSGAPLTLSK